MSVEYWAMGGYAAYVWGSFGAFVAVIAWNIAAPIGRRRALLRELVEDDRGAGDD